MSEERLFTRKELTKLSFRHQFFLQRLFTYSRMQGTGYSTAILPALKKIYKDDPDALHEAYSSQTMLYNVTPQMSELIMGMDIAIEEKGGIKSLPTVLSLKTSLMGPLSGFGDVIFSTIQQTVFGAIAANMALTTGNMLGMWLWFAWFIFVILFRPRMMIFGYERGIDLVHDDSSLLKSITRAASIVGVMTVGALIATVIYLSIPLQFVSGEVTYSIQSALDSIMPQIYPALFTIFVYWLSGKKNLSITKLVGIVFVITFVLSLLKLA